MWPSNKILMIRPASFGYNIETALTNSFQHFEDDGEAQNALVEFDHMVQQLQQSGIEVVVINDTPEPKKPDAIFPNNWFSTHTDGTCILYPMLHQNRRIERRSDIIQQVCKNPEKIIDLSYLEKENLFLEGTGSLVLDHEFKIAYAVISPRTSKEALTIFEAKTGFKALSFHAFDRAQQPIYHTNVVMALSPTNVVICLEVIPKLEQEKLLEHFAKTKKEVIEISLPQLEQFAGNMLCLKNKKNEQVMVISRTAFDAINVVQLNALKKYHQILTIDIPTIEKIGGGSVRCMMAELLS
jgi:hypothetical protein